MADLKNPLNHSALDQELAGLQADVQEGQRALHAGKFGPFDDEAVDRIKRSARAKQKTVKSTRC